SMFPVLLSHENRMRLIKPLFSVPFQIANRVRPPKIGRATRIVDPLYPGAPLRIPAAHISRTVAPSLQVPCFAGLMPDQYCNVGGIIAIWSQHPALRRKRRSCGERRAEQLDPLVSAHFAGKVHPPSIATLRDR